MQIPSFRSGLDLHQQELGSAGAVIVAWLTLAGGKVLCEGPASLGQLAQGLAGGFGGKQNHVQDKGNLNTFEHTVSPLSYVI